MPIVEAYRGSSGQRFDSRPVEPARHIPDLSEDVVEGFARQPRSLPPKYFYDARGSQLFDRICDTPEYYPTRTEEGLLARSADSVVEACRPEHIIELGSGTSRKTVALLDACERQGLAPTYWPFDVCESILESGAAHLLPRFPWLTIHALVGDYSGGLTHLPRPTGACLYVFLGGTIGNFEPRHSQAFLGELAAQMRAADRLLLGADRVKDSQVLEAAYNDAAGVTAEFNLNVLDVINRELDGAFDMHGFRHAAVYNEAASRIEMYLVALREQRVTLAALARGYRFAAGERLLTEISRKFTPVTLRDELTGAGLTMEAHYEPADGYFSLVLANAR